MQFLKEKTRILILESGLDEFSNFGYEKGSIRRIAEKSKISPGNLYRYFENKEDLFYQVIKPALDKILYIIKYKEGINDDIVLEEALDMFAKLCQSHKKEILILIQGSSGTRYSKSKDMIVDMVNERMKIKCLEGDAFDERKAFILKIQVESMITGIISILKEHKDQSSLGDVIGKFTKIHLRNLKERMEEVL